MHEWTRTYNAYRNRKVHPVNLKLKTFDDISYDPMVYYTGITSTLFFELSGVVLP